ncbi:uncharacterized protein B0H18DRAFT_1128396 [Fomitopsis serialis]|uniref:uncharacterized protein n=1 Tax=Fomitopsis serialis TaxID=139415 RepID=UPI0020077866|nr:uncharacterized protein B0H18DRAFT_1128396 [Neoantrodia serialis]KAH9911638.1 hypothetical protein B0H18DRAFT_1128396 [Neoantrodia serialis]
MGCLISHLRCSAASGHKPYTAEQLQQLLPSEESLSKGIACRSHASASDPAAFASTNLLAESLALHTVAYLRSSGWGWRRTRLGRAHQRVHAARGPVEMIIAFTAILLRDSPVLPMRQATILHGIRLALEALLTQQDIDWVDVLPLAEHAVRIAESFGSTDTEDGASSSLPSLETVSST